MKEEQTCLCNRNTFKLHIGIRIVEFVEKVRRLTGTYYSYNLASLSLKKEGMNVIKYEFVSLVW